MRSLFLSIPLWSYTLLVLCLSPLASYFGSLWGWTPGVASFAILAVPAAAAALSGSRPAAAATALIAIAASFIEVWTYDHRSDLVFPLAFPLFAACALIGLNTIAVTVVHHLRRRVKELGEQNTKYVRDLYQRERQSEAVHDVTDLAETTNEPEADSQDAEDDETVNYAMLLLTLQDIGRRVSTNLDLDTLIPTIISTAKASLQCRICQVFVWNEESSALHNPLPLRTRDSLAYVPRPKIGMGGWVIQHRQIITRNDVERDYSLQTLLEADPNMPDAIAPLAVGGELLGLLVVDEIEQDSPTFVRLLYILANIYALGIKNAQLFSRIEEMARRDGLTGLLNHASFQEELDKLVDGATESGQPLTVIMSDIDRFKRFNDTFGHQAGDHVLREVARLWTAVLPDHAVVARYGGEEFICALPHDDINRARELAELLRETTESTALYFEGQELNVTASFGVAPIDRAARTAADLVRVADETLYKAKEDGRNRVVCHGAGGTSITSSSDAVATSPASGANAH